MKYKNGELIELETQKDDSYDHQFDANFWFIISLVLIVLLSCRIYKASDKPVENTKYEKVIVPAEKVSIKARTKEDQQQVDYIEHWLKIARQESAQFGIPTSIIMAQAILESKSGHSNVCKKNNNHFGVMDDMEHYRCYKTAWESWRDHSVILNGALYKSLHGSDYKTWAVGLKKKGYADDDKYSDRLINIIEKWKLNRYDKIE